MTRRLSCNPWLNDAQKWGFWSHMMNSLVFFVSIFFFFNKGKINLPGTAMVFCLAFCFLAAPMVMGFFAHFLSNHMMFIVTMFEQIEQIELQMIHNTVQYSIITYMKCTPHLYISLYNSSSTDLNKNCLESHLQAPESWSLFGMERCFPFILWPTVFSCSLIHNDRCMQEKICRKANLPWLSVSKMNAYSGRQNTLPLTRKT